MEEQEDLEREQREVLESLARQLAEELYGVDDHERAFPLVTNAMQKAEADFPWVTPLAQRIGSDLRVLRVLFDHYIRTLEPMFELIEGGALRVGTRQMTELGQHIRNQIALDLGSHGLAPWLPVAPVLRTSRVPWPKIVPEVVSYDRLIEAQAFVVE